MGTRNMMEDNRARVMDDFRKFVNAENVKKKKANIQKVRGINGR